MVKMKIFVLSVVLVVKCCSAANILILCFPMYSHLIGPVNVGKLLQSQGHNVAMAVPPTLEAKFANQGIKLVIYHSLGDNSEEHADAILKDYFEPQPGYMKYFGVDQTKIIRNVLTRIIKDVNLNKDIENFNPDLMIMDSTVIALILTLIPYKLNIPFIFIGSAELGQYTRAPILPTVLPFKLLTYTDQMTFKQRMVNTFIELLAYWSSPAINDSLIYEYAPEKPYISLIDLPAKAQLWIIRQHSVLNYNPPTMPNVKRVGHLHEVTPKPLPQEFQSFMDSGEKGVVVVTFGAFITSVPPQIIDKLLTAFEKTRYKFIVKTSHQQANQSDKFLFQKWIPQFDLLSHKNTKLFITHCGSNGLQEAMLAGVPIIGFPIFGDQPQNAGIIVRKGYGLKLELRSFTIEELVSAIEEVISNPTYKAKMKKASAIFKSARVPPIKEAAYWINHVLTFGGDHLRSAAQDAPLWKYLGLDIIAFCLLLWHFKNCVSHIAVEERKNLKMNRVELI